MNHDKKERAKGTKPKLLIVGGFPKPGTKVYGGIVTSCRALVKSTFASTFTLDLVDTTQISNPPPGGFVRLLLAVRRFVAFVFRLMIFRPDAVMLFTSKGASLAEKGLMAWTARCFGVPSLVFPRGGALIGIYEKSKWQRHWIIFALRGARIFLCQGPAWKRFAIEYVGFPEERTKLVLNWTATPELLQVGVERRFEGPKTAIRFLFVGWLEREKGVFELLNACVRLVNDHKFTLSIAGRGRAELEAREFVKCNNLDGVASFAGWVEGDSLVDLYRCHDVFVLPSWAEGFPNAMIEAMACKLAVIVTDVGNIPDIVKDKHQALLIPSRNVAALREAMAKVMDDAALLKAVAQRGHEMALEKFSVETALPSLTAAVNQCLQ
jgi:glycosyltransferase involved in cell wall biosynthesis